MGFTWLIQFPFIFLGARTLTFPYIIFFYLGSASPALVAVYLIYKTHDPKVIAEFWQRIIDPNRIRGGFWLVIIFLYPFINILALLSSALVFGSSISFITTIEIINQPLRLISMAIFLLIFGPLPEEIGWRGFALDKLHNKLNMLHSSMIIGLFWALWHLPLFFIPGTYQNNLGVLSLNFWLFFLTLFPDSILYTWIYFKNRRSTLAAILIHFSTNFAGEIFKISSNAMIIRSLLITLTAILIIYQWKKQRIYNGT